MLNTLKTVSTVIADHYGKLMLLAAGSGIAYLLLNAISFAHKVS